MYAKYRNIVSRLSAHLVKHATIYLVGASIGASLVIAHAIPIYFHDDDAHFLEWGSTHANPLAAFTEIFTHATIWPWRPLTLMTAWIMYRLFGLHAAPYHFLVLMFYFLSLITLFKLVEAVFSRRIALVAVLAYLGTFYYLASAAFWFSDFGYTLDAVFINLSLFFLVETVKGKRHALWGIVFYLCGGLLREPPILIVPVVFAVFVWSEWKRIAPEKRRSIATLAAVLVCVGVVGSVLHPSFARRLKAGPTSLHQSALPYMFEGMKFYARALLSNSGILIWFCAFYVMLKNVLTKMHPRYYYPAVAACFIASLIATRSGVAALPVLFCALALILVQRRRESFAVIMFAPSVAALTLLDPRVRMYLYEPSMGIAVILGVALDDFIVRLSGDFARIRSLRARRAIVASTVLAVVVAAVLGFGAIARSELDALLVVSAGRQNFKDCMDYILTHFDKGEYDLVGIEYRDSGIEYYRDILPLDDYAKAKVQKPMEVYKIQSLLRAAGRSNIQVRNISYLREHGGSGRTYLLVMNDLEMRYARGLNLRTRPVFSVERRGERAEILAVDGSEPTPSP